MGANGEPFSSWCKKSKMAVVYFCVVCHKKCLWKQLQESGINYCYHYINVIQLGAKRLMDNTALKFDAWERWFKKTKINISVWWFGFALIHEYILLMLLCEEVVRKSNAYFMPPGDADNMNIFQEGFCGVREWHSNIDLHPTGIPGALNGPESLMTPVRLWPRLANVYGRGQFL